MRRDVFQAIADPIRRDIIELLAKESLTVNTVAEKFAISRPAISKHLRVLNECGLIEINKKGRERYCVIQAKQLIPAFIWIDQYRQIWEDKLDSFEEYLQTLQKRVNQMDNDELERTLTLSRIFNVPIEIVWQAWTEPDHIAKWWGPKGMNTKVIDHDFKPGGKWKYSMIMPNGNEFIADGVYKEIITQQKIVSSANFKPMTEGVEIRAQFEAKGKLTNFTFSVVHPSVEYRNQQDKMGFYNGWASTFDRLNDYLDSQK